MSEPTGRRRRATPGVPAAEASAASAPSAEQLLPGLPPSWREVEYEPSAHFTTLKRKQKKVVDGRETWPMVEFDYLAVNQRLVWFNREQRALRLLGMATTTSIIHVITEPMASGGWLATAYVRDVTGAEATMQASFTGEWSGGNVEKVGTKALGRALGALGYGTDNAPDLSDDVDDGETFSDLPETPRTRAQPAQASQAPQAPQAPHEVARTPQSAHPTHPTAQAAQATPAPAQAGAAPSTVYDIPQATDQQLTAIEKLSASLGRKSPVVTSYEHARELIRQLSGEWNAQRAREVAHA